MRVTSIDNNTFKAKNFRLVVNAVDYDRVGSRLTNFRNVGKYVKEYSNPTAKELYEQAQKTSDVKEQIRLYNKMGHYELKCLNLKEFLKEKFNKFVTDYIFRL